MVGLLLLAFYIDKYDKMPNVWRERERELRNVDHLLSINNIILFGNKACFRKLDNKTLGVGYSLEREIN